MPKALVTMVALSSPRLSCLICVDLESGQKSLVDLGVGSAVLRGTGLAADAERIYVYFAVRFNHPHAIAALDRKTLRPVFLQEVPEIKMGHSLLAYGGHLYVVSTGTDEIWRYKIGPRGLGSPKLHWAASETRSDTHHLNSLAVWNGRIVVSALGPHWVEQTSGYIACVDDGKRLQSGLDQPHSVLINGGEFFWCDANSGSLKSSRGKSWQFGRYLRGLSLIGDDKALVGLSHTRHRGESCRPDCEGACALVLSDLARGSVEKTIDMSAFGHEIYDIHLWQPCAGKPIHPPIPLEREIKNLQELLETQRLWASRLKERVDVQSEPTRS